MYLVLNKDLGDKLYVRMTIDQESIGIIPSNPIIGITDKRREEFEQYISKIEEIHFRNDNGKDATVLHTYLSYHLLSLRERWNFNLIDYTLIIEEFGTPLGSVLSNLYFAMVESFSGLMSVDDSIALCKAFLDTYPDGNINDSKYWKKELATIEEKNLIQILENIPLSLTRKFRLQVFLFFLRPFVPYSYIDPLPLSPDDFLLQKKAESWIATLNAMIAREEKLIAAKESQEAGNKMQEIPSAITHFETKAEELIQSEQTTLKPVLQWKCIQKAVVLASISPAEITAYRLAKDYHVKLEEKENSLKRRLEDAKKGKYMELEIDFEKAKTLLRSFLKID